jgi:carboxynorspermidine decarboxylase
MNNSYNNDIIDEDVLKPLLEAVDNIKTPAFVLSEEAVKQVLKVVDDVHKNTNCNMVYALKPLVNRDVMQLMTNHVKGFAASSLFEAKYSREIIGDNGSVHITNPGYLAHEIDELADICDYVSLNSISQYEMFSDGFVGKSKIGLRINPQVSVVKDKRYDPCRRNSKLGVPINTLAQLIQTNKSDKTFLQNISGLQFHTNSEAYKYKAILKTVNQLISKVSPLLHSVEWINLGGGYFFDDEADYTPLYEAIDILQTKFNLRVYFEPGAGYVVDAGFIVASVIDLFESDGGSTIAVLDTTINHMPEVFEYQYRPEIYGDTKNGPYNYIAVGSTCLAGDLFGSYSFNEPLTIGSKLIFPEMGAYTQVKSHMFNGLNLPSIYWLNSKECLLRKSFTYEDYISRI